MFLEASNPMELVTVRFFLIFLADSLLQTLEPLMGCPQEDLEERNERTNSRCISFLSTFFYYLLYYFICFSFCSFVCCYVLFGSFLFLFNFFGITLIRFSLLFLFLFFILNFRILPTTFPTALLRILFWFILFLFEQQSLFLSFLFQVFLVECFVNVHILYKYSVN